MGTTGLGGGGGLFNRGGSTGLGTSLQSGQTGSFFNKPLGTMSTLGGGLGTLGTGNTGLGGGGISLGGGSYDCILKPGFHSRAQGFCYILLACIEHLMVCVRFCTDRKFR